MRFQLLTSDELRQASAQWNALWAASTVTIPSARAEHLLHWKATFARGGETLNVLVVEEEGRWLAGLPIVVRRRGPLVIGGLPTNPWQPSGELLLDESVPAPSTLKVLVDGLVEGLQSLRCSLFDFSIVLPQTARWQGFLAALEPHSIRAVVAPKFEVGLIDAARDWTSQAEHWSANHRRRVKRNQKFLDASPELTFDFHMLDDSANSSGVLDALWRLEQSSWKGQEGGAVAGDDKLVQFYRQQAALMSSREAAGDLSAHVAILRHSAKPIAAMYYWQAKDVFHLWKSAYDPLAAQWSPGSLLLQEVLRRGVERRECRMFNLMGPLSAAHESWTTRKFEVARMMFAPRFGLGGVAVEAYRAYRRLRGRTPWAIGPVGEAAPLPQASGLPAPIVLCQ